LRLAYLHDEGELILLEEWDPASGSVPPRPPSPTQPLGTDRFVVIDPAWLYSTIVRNIISDPMVNEDQPDRQDQQDQRDRQDAIQVGVVGQPPVTLEASLLSADEIGRRTAVRDSLGHRSAEKMASLLAQIGVACRAPAAIDRDGRNFFIIPARVTAAKPPLALPLPAPRAAKRPPTRGGASHPVNNHDHGRGRANARGRGAAHERGNGGRGNGGQHSPLRTHGPRSEDGAAANGADVGGGGEGGESGEGGERVAVIGRRIISYSADDLLTPAFLHLLQVRILGRPLHIRELDHPY
jgi:hypothetical protein